MLAADAMTLSMEFLKNKIPKNNLPEPIGKIVIGTVAGDMHDIGCRIVSSLFRVSGFEVHFIGRDVPAERFIDTAEKIKADIIGASSLLTTTMAEQKFLIKKIEKRGLDNKYLVMIGGGPITEEWSKEIGANGYAPDAVSAVAKAKELMKLD
jgi:dimethylamine corrinoid protein